MAAEKVKFGSVWGGEVAYVLPDGRRVAMWRKGQRVRFYDEDGRQVGPEQANVYPAVLYAAAEGWVDPTAPHLSLACTREVRSQLAAAS